MKVAVVAPVGAGVTGDPAWMAAFARRTLTINAIETRQVRRLR